MNNKIRLTFSWTILKIRKKNYEVVHFFAYQSESIPQRTNSEKTKMFKVKLLNNGFNYDKHPQKGISKDVSNVKKMTTQKDPFERF